MAAAAPCSELLSWGDGRTNRARWSPRSQARALWFALALLLNTAFALAAWVGPHDRFAARSVEIGLLVSTLAVAARHEAIVRAMFILGSRCPSYRWHVLTDHVGQFHRAMAIAGTIWFSTAIAAAGVEDRLAAAAGLVVLTFLVAMMWTARDRARHRRHDRFELVHRYGGWSVLVILVWLVARTASIPSGAGASMAGAAGQPVVVLSATLVAVVAHPWLGVRRVPVTVLDVTEQVVVLALPGRVSVGEFVRVSRDGKQWHSFAVATTGTEGASRFCVVIRRAGDWTERLAADAETGRLGPFLWVRRMRGCGFMYHAKTYRHVLFVATGAGIGPVLPYLLGDHALRFSCLWIARDHRRALGGALVDRIVGGGSVQLIDTTVSRPDVDGYVASCAAAFDAVFVVGNHVVRDQVAAACQRLGVPWYGPTFDS